MTLFEFLFLCILAIFVVLFVVLKKRGITINYNKTITNINKLDDMQLEIAKENLAELKKYNENAAKQTVETSQAIRTMTTAVQEIMGVNDETGK